MCGRYTGRDDECDDLFELYTRTRRKYPEVTLKSGEIFPTDTVPVLFEPGLTPLAATWGFPGYKGVIINARAETAAEKITFADSLINRRCAVPTTGYYEWDSDKRKYLFRLPGEELVWLAGFCKRFADGYRFVILTTEANESASDIHERMPVILRSDMLHVWTGSSREALGLMNAVMPAMQRYEAV